MQNHMVKYYMGGGGDWDKNEKLRCRENCANFLKTAWEKMDLEIYNLYPFTALYFFLLLVEYFTECQKKSNFPKRSENGHNTFWACRTNK